MITDNQGFPNISAPIADPKTGQITAAFLRFIISLWQRTGGPSNLVGQGIYPGKVDTYAGPLSTIPEGWLACNGSAVSRATYAGLYRAIGDSWGAGDGSTTFNVPNADGKFVVGAGSLYGFTTTGGAATHALSVPELAAHAHGVTDPQHTHVFTGTPHAHAITDPQHTHTITDTGHFHSDGMPNATDDVSSGSDLRSAINGNTGTETTGITVNSASTDISINDTAAAGTNANSPTDITINDTGSGQPFSILPPYVAMNLIIKT